MKKILVLLIATILAMSSAFAISGSIWTTKDDCGDEEQDVNHYAVGEHVFINGKNFDPETEYLWDITGKPGQASCDPDFTVASGNDVTDSEGAFCFDAYTVALDDCGEYGVNFDNKNDNYRVDEEIPIPEFTSIGVGLALAGAGYYMFRRRSKK